MLWSRQPVMIRAQTDLLMQYNNFSIIVTMTNSFSTRMSLVAEHRPQLCLRTACTAVHSFLIPNPDMLWAHTSNDFSRYFIPNKTGQCRFLGVSPFYPYKTGYDGISEVSSRRSSSLPPFPVLRLLDLDQLIFIFPSRKTRLSKQVKYVRFRSISGTYSKCIRNRTTAIILYRFRSGGLSWRKVQHSIEECVWGGIVWQAWPWCRRDDITGESAELKKWFLWRKTPNACQKVKIQSLRSRTRCVVGIASHAARSPCQVGDKSTRWSELIIALPLMVPREYE